MTQTEHASRATIVISLDQFAARATHARNTNLLAWSACLTSQLAKWEWLVACASRTQIAVKATLANSTRTWVTTKPICVLRKKRKTRMFGLS